MTPTIDDRGELLPTERIGIVMFILMDNRGQKFTTAKLAELADIKHSGVWKMLSKLSRKIPIIQEIDGWVIY